MNLKNPLFTFFVTFILFHIVLFMMHGEKQVYWYIYTGLMLVCSIGYIYYERNVDSRRLMDSIITGVLTSFAIVLIHTVLSLIIKDIHYFQVLKSLVHLGVYFKWQLIISLVVAIPLHELFFRSVLQNELMNKYNTLIACLFTSLLSTSLFFWSVNWKVIIFIFIVQMILAASYAHTKRLITPMIGQILSIIILILIHGS